MSPLEQQKLFLNRRGWGRNCRSKSYRRRQTGAGETTPSAKGLSCKHQDLSFTPEPMWEKAWRQIHPSTEGTETGCAWSSLASQSNLLVKLQVCERETLSQRKGGQCLRNHTWVCPLVSTCTRTHEHVHVHTHKYTQNKQAKRKQKQPDAEKAWRQVGAFTEQANVLPKEWLPDTHTVHICIHACTYTGMYYIHTNISYIFDHCLITSSA